MVLVAALLLAVPFLFHAGSPVHAADNEITGVTLSSLNPGELAIAWDAPSRAPTDYRVTWKKSTARWPSYKNDNTVEGGNAFVQGTSHTVTGLEESAAYQVRVRARYFDVNDNLTESGPWSDPPVELTVSATPPPKKGTNAREGDSNQGRSTNPPAKPTGITYGASYNNVLLFWTDPGDDSITGYQVLRGPDAANLAVLTDDTGSTSASYSDDTVSAETTYACAILARNAGGLSPQSDTVTIRTGPAPVEPEIDLAVAGAEFTLDGQMLDTTGTCSESDIAAISDDCTLDIFDATVPLTIDGTLSLSPGQVLVFQIARDSSGVVSARQAATQADFPNDGDSKDITFPAGRNLLRAIHAGTDQHYFGVNVLPYWELNDQRLSKDSACRAATDPSLADITDADCILTNFKDGSLQFHNVIQEQFNVYVFLNGVRIIAEPSTTTLAEPFTVTLEDGENLLRIRLAAKGGQPTAEVYDSDSFYYKVTGTDFLVSNLAQTAEGIGRIATETQVATQFTTGSNPNGYTVSKVTLPISVGAASVTPALSIYTDVSGSPGSSIKPLTNPGSITVSTSTAPEAEFGADDYKLNAETTYWLVLENPSSSQILRISLTTEDSEDGSAPGWSIGNVSKLSTDAGASYRNVSDGLTVCRSASRARWRRRGRPTPP